MVRPERAYVHFICYSPFSFRLQVQSFVYKCMKVVWKFLPCLSTQTCLPLLYPCPSIYRVRLGAGVLDVYSSWWACAEAIWPSKFGSVYLGSVVGVWWFGSGSCTLARQWTRSGSVEAGSVVAWRWSWTGGKCETWFGVPWFGRGWFG